MSKRIVVGLDPSEYCKSAQQLAIARAKLFDGKVIGVGVVDLPGIEGAVRGAGVGAGHYAKKSRDHHCREAEQTVERLIADFEKTCIEAGVDFEVENHTGDPVDVILDVARGADIIAIGAQTHFHFETQEESGDTLAKILRAQVCPVFVAPKEINFPPKQVMFPYDGSINATRAMRIFVMLTEKIPIAHDVTLLRVEDNHQSGITALSRPAQYLEAYGYNVKKKVLHGDPQEVILEEAKREAPNFVVLGATGKSSVRTFFFGSVTRSFIEDGTVPFVVSA